jgi:hypothetical protein
MKMLPGTQRNRHRKSFFAASSLLLLLATQTVAQSGRRTPKPAQPPVITPKTDSESSSKNNARELKQKVSLLVGSESSSKHLLSEDAIFEYLLRHLGEFKNVSTTSLGDIKRDARLSARRARRIQ